jgi:hypothetical protein
VHPGSRWYHPGRRSLFLTERGETPCVIGNREAAMSYVKSEADRAAIAQLKETRAVDFDAVGAALSKFSATEVELEDGEYRFCGTMSRYVVLYRLGTNVGPIEEIQGLREIAHELNG